MTDSTTSVPAPPPPATDARVEREARQATALKLADMLLAQGRSVTIWRCSKCGKWSHAKRRPNHHERQVGGAALEDLDELPEIGSEFDGARVVDVQTSGYNGDPDFNPWAYVVLACGPFDEWRAEKVAA